MKCTGMNEAHKMVGAARDVGLKVMIGCMTETSCGISAAAQLAPMADWVDLDGALLIKNDPFVGARIISGSVVMPTGPGIGVEDSRR
jgi:L-alanine-DL-glutamate epimerase-like enolase superfamily enzyme